MEKKQMDDLLERKIKDRLAQNAPEPDIVDKKMEEAYHEIRKLQRTRKRKLSVAVKFSSVAAILALVMIYCLKNPAIAAQIPLIGNIFRGLEGQVSFPGEYSKKSIKLNTVADLQDNRSKQEQPGGNMQTDQENDKISSAQTDQGENPNGSAQAEHAEDRVGDVQTDQVKDKVGNMQTDQAENQERDAKNYQKTMNGVTVTLSEVAYDNHAIYVAVLVQNEKDFVKDTLIPDGLCYDAQVKLYRADGSTEEFHYESEGRFVRTIEGEFVDTHTFKGIFQFSESGFDLLEYTACELTFLEFGQQLKTGETETIIVPDYGEVSQMIPDSVSYQGPWKFYLDFDGLEVSEQEVAVHDVNDKGFGIEKVVKTAFEIYAVPILPEGEKDYDYIATIWDADGKPLENRNWGDYLSMSHYGKDVSKVTVYLLKTKDFFESKGNNAYLQPEKAIYRTTVSMEE